MLIAVSDKTENDTLLNTDHIISVVTYRGETQIVMDNGAAFEVRENTTQIMERIKNG